MSEEEKNVKEMADGINGSIEELKSAMDKKANVEDLEAKHTEITDKLEAVASKEDMTKQQEQLDEISTQLKQIGELQGASEKSFDEQLEEQLKGDEFKEKAKGKRQSVGEITSLELDIPSTRKGTYGITTTDVNSGTIEAQVEPGVEVAPWRLTPIWNAIQKGTIVAGRDSISWWEETTRTDSAEMVAEETAPAAQSAKTWTKQSMDIMMIADHTKVSRSGMEDFEYMRDEIMDLVNNGIPRKRETQLLSGTGLTVYLKGLTQYAQTFACPANLNKVPEANDADVLMAAILQVNNGYTTDTEKKGYIPNIVLVNPGSVTNMQLLKRTDGSYLLPPFLSSNGLNISGVRVIPSLDLTADTFLVGDFSQAKAYIKRNMRISWHYENEDDVLKDLVLVFASMRIAGIKISASAAYGFVYGTFASGKPLIEEVTG